MVYAVVGVALFVAGIAVIGYAGVGLIIPENINECDTE